MPSLIKDLCFVSLTLIQEINQDLLRLPERPFCLLSPTLRHHHHSLESPLAGNRYAPDH